MVHVNASDHIYKIFSTFYMFSTYVEQLLTLSPASNLLYQVFLYISLI